MEEKEEIWKDIKGFEGLYQISNLGRVKSLPKYTYSRGYPQLRKEKLLKPVYTGKNRNYATVCLNSKYRFKIHRLVAEAFISNPNNYPCVNHKDENPRNNDVDNLEWCTYQYNTLYSNNTIKRGRKKLINRGKDFESRLKLQLEKLQPKITIDRLYDTTMGYKNIYNPCDFIIYSYPNILYVECKAIHGKYLNFNSHIRKTQWDALLCKSKTNGVIAGILCWFIDYDKTVFVPITHLDNLKTNDYKSFNIIKDFDDNLDCELFGIKKQVYFNYDLDRFLKEIKDVK